MQGKTYARVFRAHQNAKSRFIVVGLQAEMTAEARAEYKRLYPRRKTFNGSKLPAEFTAALKAKYVSLSRRLYAHKERQEKKLAAILDHMAAQADMTPSASMSVLATTDSSGWGSQGLGANKYAEASLAWERDVLLQAGFAAEIRQESANYRLDAYGFGYTWCTYALAANAADWQLDALKRQSTAQVWLRAVENAGANPRVYNPFLPYGMVSWDNR